MTDSIDLFDTSFTSTQPQNMQCFFSLKFQKQMNFKYDECLEIFEFEFGSTDRMAK